DRLLRDDDAQPVRERLLDAWRELEGSFRADTRAILCDGEARKKHCHGPGHSEDAAVFVVAIHFVPPSGTRSITVRFAGTSHFRAAARTSAEVTLSRSLRIVL